MSRQKLIWKIFPSYVAIMLLAVVGTLWHVNRATKTLIRDKTRDELTALGNVLREQVLELVRDDTPDFERFARRLGNLENTRVTVILPNGKVPFDSFYDVSLMDNHATRPEVQAAFGGQVGEEARYSNTLKQEMMYLALPCIRDGHIVAVCRIARPLSLMVKTRHDVFIRILVGAAVALLAAMIFSFWISRHIIAPVQDMQRVAARLAEGDFSARLRLPATYELAGLAGAMNTMASELADRIQTVTRQHNELEAILTSMVEGVLAVDDETNILIMNTAAAEMLGTTPELAIGKSILESIRYPGLHKIVNSALEKEEPVGGEIVLQLDRSEIYLQAHAGPLTIPTIENRTHRRGAVLVLNDVTQLKKLENLRRDFAANVSHELRTPITSIKGFVETLKDGAIEDQETAGRFLDIILAHTERLNALITDLMSLAEIEQDADRRAKELTKMPLLPRLEAARNARKRKSEEAGVPVRIDCEPELQVALNPVLFEQAIVNLVDNAITYSPEGAEVTVSARTADNRILVAVEDHGCGIAPEHLDRLFERFYRADKARSRENGGTGLGLAIVKHVAQAHNGSVTVKSTPGTGSTFTISLPCI